MPQLELNGVNLRYQDDEFDRTWKIRYSPPLSEEPFHCVAVQGLRTLVDGEPYLYGLSNPASGSPGPRSRSIYYFSTSLVSTETIVAHALPPEFDMSLITHKIIPASGGWMFMAAQFLSKGGLVLPRAYNFIQPKLSRVIMCPLPAANWKHRIRILSSTPDSFEIDLLVLQGDGMRQMSHLVRAICKDQTLDWSIVSLHARTLNLGVETMEATGGFIQDDNLILILSPARNSSFPRIRLLRGYSRHLAGEPAELDIHTFPISTLDQLGPVWMAGDIDSQENSTTFAVRTSDGGTTYVCTLDIKIPSLDAEEEEDENVENAE
jgi:hypothetical protein